MAIYINGKILLSLAPEGSERDDVKNRIIFLPGEASIRERGGYKSFNQPFPNVTKLSHYYTQVRPNLTILSVNSNFCNNYNLWLLPWPEDPAGQLAWLAKELARAESSGSLVYIVSHIPPGLSNCLGAWSHQVRLTQCHTRNLITININSSTPG